jgi:hypothetical protein
MIGRSIDFKYAALNAVQAFNSRKLSAADWKNNVRIARRTSRATVALKRSEGLEYQYALTDIHRAIIKKAMMTPDQAYQKNKVTKQHGLAWVLCG